MDGDDEWAEVVFGGRVDLGYAGGADFGEGISGAASNGAKGDCGGGCAEEAGHGDVLN